MGQRVALHIEPRLARTLAKLADKEGMDPGALGTVYLDYCILHHADVLKFERSTGNQLVPPRQETEKEAGGNEIIPTHTDGRNEPDQVGEEDTV